MEFDKYLRFVNSLTWNDLFPNNYMFRDGIKLATEGAEILDLMEKQKFQGHPLDLKKLYEEMGDLMYYLVHLCGQLGITLEDVMENNHEKLRKRYPTGKFTPEDSIARVDQNPVGDPYSFNINTPPISNGETRVIGGTWVDDGNGQGYFVQEDSPRLQTLPEEATPYPPVQEVSTTSKYPLAHSLDFVRKLQESNPSIRVESIDKDWNDPPTAAPIKNIRSVTYLASTFKDLDDPEKRVELVEEFEELPHEGEDIED